MSEAKARPSNLICQIIDEDLASGKYTTTHTRPPSEPNGYLHIGHAKSTCLNFGITQGYQGQCNLRFDDMNPVKEDIEYAELIKNDVEWSDPHWTGDIRYFSDYSDQLRAYAVEPISKGLVYVDELSADEIREYRGMLTQSGKNNPYRDHSVEENLALFEKMRTGGFEEGKACLRAETDMALPFIVMRDPVLYRIKFVEYHRTGNKWRIYLMYDSIHCISDAPEGITYSLHMLEFQGNRRLYDWALGNTTILIHPRQCKSSRLNLEYIVMSKRKLNLLMTDKHVEGWDDPHIPTISGLRRRGHIAAAIRELCRRIGAIKQGNTIEIASLESCVREDLNENVPRAMVVTDPVKLVIKNYPQGESELVTMPNHPNKSEIGNCEVLFSDEIWIDRADFREEANKQHKRLVMGKEVRLRNVYVTEAKRVEKDAEGDIITIFCTYDADILSKDPANDRKVKGIIHWVSVSRALPIEIRLHDRLFSVSNPGVAEDFLSVINPESLVIKQGYGEPPPKTAVAGKALRPEREGYFRLDSRYTTTDKLVFSCTVGLRDTWAKVGE